MAAHRRAAAEKHTEEQHARQETAISRRLNAGASAAKPGARPKPMPFAGTIGVRAIDCADLGGASNEIAREPSAAKGRGKKTPRKPAPDYDALATEFGPSLGATGRQAPPPVSWGPPARPVRAAIPVP